MARSLTSTLDKLAASGKLDKFTTAQPTTGELQTSIEISRIIPDPDQPRRTFDEDQLQSLSDSIAAQGVLQPITVQPENADGQYLIIMGERRWRAAQLVGLTSIPSIIRKATAELRAIQLTENVQRSDLTTMEIARAVEQMRKDGKKRSEIARALGWGQVQVSQFAGILDMPDALQDLANQNVSARPLSDLHALWKKDEDAARKFISESLNLKFYVAWQCLASLRVRRRILATSAQAVELSIVRSQSLANRRHLPSHAKVRSTTHRMGSRTKPFALSGRLTVSSVHSSPMACRSLSPAYPPSVKIWRKHGNFLPAALSRSGAPSRSWMLAA